MCFRVHRPTEPFFPRVHCGFAKAHAWGVSAEAHWSRIVNRIYNITTTFMLFTTCTTVAHAFSCMALRGFILQAALWSYVCTCLISLSWGSSVENPGCYLSTLLGSVLFGRKHYRKLDGFEFNQSCICCLEVLIFMFFCVRVWDFFFGILSSVVCFVYFLFLPWPVFWDFILSFVFIFCLPALFK